MRGASWMALVTLAAASVASAAIEYNTTNLGTLGGTFSRGYGINATGGVAGVSIVSDNSTFRGFRSAGVGSPSAISLLSGGSSGYAMGLNDSGTVVGFAEADGRFPTPLHAFSAAASVPTDLHAVVSAGGTLSYAYGINNAGSIVGQSTVAGDGSARGYVATGGSAQFISPTGGFASTTAMGINASGLVAGYQYNGTWSYNRTGNMIGGTTGGQAFIYDAGTTTMTPIAGSNSYALGINNSGQVVGQAGGFAFLYSGGTTTNLTPSGATSSLAEAINNLGAVVGSFTNAGVQHAFVYRAGTLVDLNTVVSLPGWTLVQADGINDLGQITVYAKQIGGSQTNAFLLSPTGLGPVAPEPTSLSLLGAGALALGTRRRK